VHVDGDLRLAMVAVPVVDARFDDPAPGAVHDIGVVAGVAVERVEPRPAVEGVVPERVRDRIVAAEAGEQVRESRAAEGVARRRAVEGGHDLPTAWGRVSPRPTRL